MDDELKTSANLNKAALQHAHLQSPNLQLTSTFTTYVEVTKPKIWSLLLFTALSAAIVAGGPRVSLTVLATVFVAVTLGSAGANTLTNYFDRDIDAIMNRTKHRPLPSKRIYPAYKAFYFGLILSGLSVLTAYSLNPLSAILMLIGLLDNVVIYSKILKRRNPVNIILGGFSGGMPALIGYAAVVNIIDLLSLTIAALVVLWIPSHIWSLALHSKEDYSKAHVPMLPVVVEEKTAVRCIASTSILFVFFSLIPAVTGSLGAVYLVLAVSTGVVMLTLSFLLLRKPTQAKAWTLFKYSSPHLAILFSAMIIDSLL